jgi:hypothetical protein
MDVPTLHLPRFAMQLRNRLPVELSCDPLFLTPLIGVEGQWQIAKVASTATVHLRESLHPAVEFVSDGSDLAFPVNLPAGILDAVGDCLLVNIQTDLISLATVQVDPKFDGPLKPGQ